MFLPEPCSRGRGQYYTEIGREGYYIEGGEPRGEWFGQGAEQLELRGKIQKDHFKNLFRGLDPRSTKPLVEIQHRRGKASHRPGMDGVFRPPKSVSVAWALVDSAKARSALQDAHDEAVRDAVAYFEEHLAFTRRGHGGKVLERAGLCVGLFQHGTSRAGDCDLHTHAVFLNVTYRKSDASWGTLKNEPLYDHQKLLGALYRASLAHRLLRQGWEIEREASGFRLKAVPRRLEEDFSKRSREIDSELEARKARGEAYEGHALRDRVAKETRRQKRHTPRAELFPKWRVEAGCSIPSPERRARSIGSFGALADAAVKQLCLERTWFTREDLTHALAAAAQGGEAGLAELEGRASLATSTKGLRSLGSDQTTEYFTATRTLEEESRVFAEARALSARKRAISDKHVQSALRAHKKLSEEQSAAVRQLVHGADITCLTGYAGTGKTYALSAVRQSFESAGYRVVGTATAARAAGELMRGAKIRDCRSVASCVWHLEPSLRERFKHFCRGLKYGKQTPPVRFDKKTVLVVDEASMVGTRELRKLLQHARRAGARVILSGDPQQLPAIQSAAPFRRLSCELGSAKLQTIIRQNAEWEREAIQGLAEGEVEGYFREAAAKGRITIGSDKDAAREELLLEWRMKRTKRLKHTLVLAATNRDRNLLNEELQSIRYAEGELATHRSVRVKGKRFFQHDRVVCLKNNRREGYCNGELGTVEAFQFGIKGLCAIVSLDRKVEKPGLWRGRQAPVRVKVPMEHLDLGYALTTHKAQGTTVERAFVLGGRALLSRALAYVQVSRAKEFTRLYFADEDVGEGMRTLIAKTKRGNLEQELATEKGQELEQSLRLAP